MKCNIGSHEAELVFSFNFYVFINGNHIFITEGCKECAEKMGIWCERHNIQHELEFRGQTACSSCVKKLEEKYLAEPPELIRKLSSGLPKYFWKTFTNFFGEHGDNDREHFLLHELAILAACEKVSIEEEVNRISANKNCDPLLIREVKSGMLRMH